MKKNIYFASLLSLILLLTACAGEPQAPAETEAPLTVSASEITQTTAENPTELTPPITAAPDPDSACPYAKVSLSGNADDRFLATDFCYIETEYAFLLLEKDIVLPGNYAKVTDTIISVLEELTGLKHDPDTYSYYDSDFASSYYGFNPWEGLSFGRKIPVQIVVDRNSEGYISWAFTDCLTLVTYELYSDEFWNSVPDYRDNPWRRLDYYSYIEMAHELTHVIQLRNVTLSRIMTEGSAEYFSSLAVQEASRRLPEITDDTDNVYECSIPEPITAENAERIFISDYREISHADRGAEYTFGKKLCEYLNKTYGSSFYADYIEAINAAGMHPLGDEERDALLPEYAEMMKTVFADTVFQDFGAQYR